MQWAQGGNNTVSWYTPANFWNDPYVGPPGPSGIQYYSDNTPYHFVATYDGTDLRFYKNSVLYYTQSATVDIDPTLAWLACDVGGGAPTTVTYFKMRTYDAVLDAGSVLNNFNVEKANYGY